MFTTITILEHLWDSPQLRSAFSIEDKSSLREAFDSVTREFSNYGFDWYEMTLEQNYPEMRLKYRTREEWDAMIRSLFETLLLELKMGSAGLTDE